MQHESRLAVAKGFTFMKTNCLGGTFVRHSCFDKLCGSHRQNSKAECTQMLACKFWSCNAVKTSALLRTSFTCMNRFHLGKSVPGFKLYSKPITLVQYWGEEIQLMPVVFQQTYLQMHFPSLFVLVRDYFLGGHTWTSQSLGYRIHTGSHEILQSVPKRKRETHILSKLLWITDNWFK